MTALDKEIAFLKSLKYNAVKPKAASVIVETALEGCQCDFCRRIRGELPVGPESPPPMATWEDEDDLELEEEDDDDLLEEDLEYEDEWEDHSAYDYDDEDDDLEDI